MIYNPSVINKTVELCMDNNKKNSLTANLKANIIQAALAITFVNVSCLLGCMNYFYHDWFLILNNVINTIRPMPFTLKWIMGSSLGVILVMVFRIKLEFYLEKIIFHNQNIFYKIMKYNIISLISTLVGIAIMCAFVHQNTGGLQCFEIWISSCSRLVIQLPTELALSLNSSSNIQVSPVMSAIVFILINICKIAAVLEISVIIFSLKPDSIFQKINFKSLNRIGWYIATHLLLCKPLALMFFYNVTGSEGVLYATSYLPLIFLYINFMPIFDLILKSLEKGFVLEKDEDFTV